MRVVGQRELRGERAGGSAGDFLGAPVRRERQSRQIDGLGAALLALISSAKSVRSSVGMRAGVWVAGTNGDAAAAGECANASALSKAAFQSCLMCCSKNSAKSVENPPICAGAPITFTSGVGGAP